ncbi:MAG: hypothetical protein IJC78_04855 [Clostridia bacterium]|nr:hypothetical protein [Clostridia bacterium]
MQHIEKTSTNAGQVSGKKMYFPERLMQFAKRIREETAKKQAETDMLLALDTIRTRRDTISENLNFITDTDCAEICMYQLKAADLDYNRHIRMAKETAMKDARTREESV